MGISKVVYGSETLIDLTNDTVSAEVLASGYTATNAAGNRVTGTAKYAVAPVANGNAVATNGILFGAVDSTSTSTVFTATVDGLTELYDGVTVMLKNGVVTSAANFTININNLGAKPVYNNMATGNPITPTNPTRESTIFNINYTLMFVYSENLVDGGCWINYRGYNSDTNTIGYQLRTNSTVMKTADQSRYYRMFFTSADGTHWVPANTAKDNSATSTKTVNQRPINPFGRIIYFSYTTNLSAESDVPAAYCWSQYTVALGYSFNRTGAALTLATKTPVYLACAPQSDGSAIMDSTTPIVQALPNTADGKIYIFLGIAYSATNIELIPQHPVYYHDGTAIRIWIGGAIPTAIQPATATPVMDGTAAVGTSAKYAREDHVHPSDTTKADVAQPVNIDVTADASWNLTLTQNSITELSNGYTHVSNNDIFCFRLLDNNSVTWSTRLEWDGTGNTTVLNFKTPFVEYPNNLGYGWIRVFYDDEDSVWVARIDPFPVYNGGVS